MDEPERLSDEESHAMVAAPLAVEHLAGGTVRVTKAGIVGVGDTLEAAIRDMAGKFRIEYVRPQWPKDLP